MTNDTLITVLASLAGLALSYAGIVHIELHRLKRQYKEHLDREIEASKQREEHLRACAEMVRKEAAFTESLVKDVGRLQKELTEARNSQTGVPVCHVRDLIDAIGIPERNCSCHTGAAPCHDCTDYGGLRHIIDDMDLDNRKESSPSAFQDLLKIHERLLEKNPYCYFEVAYIRTTGWMAWLCTNALELDKNSRIIARGQGVSVEAACKDAIDSIDPVES